MILRNLIFNPEIVEQRLRAGMMSHHEQQASERGIQQQHHVLWLAYNGIVVQETSINSGTFSTDTPDNNNFLRGTLVVPLVAAGIARAACHLDDNGVEQVRSSVAQRL